MQPDHALHVLGSQSQDSHDGLQGDRPVPFPVPGPQCVLREHPHREREEAFIRQDEAIVGLQCRQRRAAPRTNGALDVRFGDSRDEQCLLQVPAREQVLQVGGPRQGAHGR